MIPIGIFFLVLCFINSIPENVETSIIWHLSNGKTFVQFFQKMKFKIYEKLYFLCSSFFRIFCWIIIHNVFYKIWSRKNVKNGWNLRERRMLKGWNTLSCYVFSITSNVVQKVIFPQKNLLSYGKFQFYVNLTVF